MRPLHPGNGRRDMAGFARAPHETSNGVRRHGPHSPRLNDALLCCVRSAEFVEREEKRQSLHKDAVAAWGEYEETALFRAEQVLRQQQPLVGRPPSA
jgi:hypothetical protein